MVLRLGGHEVAFMDPWRTCIALNDSECTLQSRKVRKSIADMQNGHEAQVNAVMDKYNSLCAKVSAVLGVLVGTTSPSVSPGPADAIPLCCSAL